MRPYAGIRHEHGVDSDGLRRNCCLRLSLDGILDWSVALEGMGPHPDMVWDAGTSQWVCVGMGSDVLHSLDRWLLGVATFRLWIEVVGSPTRGRDAPIAVFEVQRIGTAQQVWHHEAEVSWHQSTIRRLGVDGMVRYRDRVVEVGLRGDLVHRRMCLFHELGHVWSWQRCRERLGVVSVEVGERLAYLYGWGLVKRNGVLVNRLDWRRYHWGNPVSHTWRTLDTNEGVVGG